MGRSTFDVDNELHDRVERAATLMGSTPAQLVERALEHYLGHVEQIERSAVRPARRSEPVADWARARQTMIASRCAYSSCPHAGDCPVELCPL